MSADFSNDATHKLHAAVNYNHPNTDNKFPANYIAACGHWFARMSESDRLVLSVAASAFGRGHNAQALRIAEILPPAPVCPLL